MHRLRIVLRHREAAVTDFIERVAQAKTYADLEPCSDGGCIIRKPRGMQTNGGCGCLKELRWPGSDGGPLKSLLTAVRIIRLMRDEIARLESELRRRRQ